MTKRSRKTSAGLPVVGWREWVALPDLGISVIKAKLDTGARSSSLHAFNVHTFTRRGKTFVRFSVHPMQRDAHTKVEAEAEVLEYRTIKSSSGQPSRRPVILTTVDLLNEQWTIELTLAGRDEMGFRMLLGREAMRGRLLVDSGRSYFGGRQRPTVFKKTNKPGKSRRG